MHSWSENSIISKIISKFCVKFMLKNVLSYNNSKVRIGLDQQRSVWINFVFIFKLRNLALSTYDLILKLPGKILDFIDSG